jgi:hypothetical protein
MKPIPLILLIALIVGGCQTRGIDPNRRNATWTLAKMELDKALLANTGGLPMFYAPTGEVGTGTPRATGSLRINDRGLVACSVSVFEPIVALGGTKSLIEYPLVNFNGRSEEDGRRLVMEDVDSGLLALGKASVLHVEALEEERLRVRAATGTKMLPYVYYFDPGSLRPVPINVPYVDR